MNFHTFFEQYCKNFETNYPESKDPFILKKIHSENVAKECEQTAKKLRLDKDSINFSLLTGLFHDIGRFPQFARYKTFNDSLSEDHGRLSAIEAVKHKITDHIEKERKSAFIYSLFFHNKKYLPLSAVTHRSTKEAEKSLFLKILRDCDKLDIFRVVLERYENQGESKNFIEMDFTDSEHISEKIVKDITNQIPAEMSDIKSITDLKLFQLSWIFDFNFKVSSEEIKKRGIIERLYDVTPHHDRVELCFNAVSKYLNTDTI